MTATDVLSMGLTVMGLFFFGAGTVGLLRFPDVFARLHALTKADNLGLGLVVLGAAIRQPDVAGVLKVVLVWLLALVASATSSYMIADRAIQERELGQ